MNQPAHPAVAALSAAIADAVESTRGEVDDITVESLEAAEWPDSCLGLATDDEACLDVVTPGYRIRLGDGLAYRADQKGNVRQERDDVNHPHVGVIRLHYKISGGITGRVSEFKTDSYQLSKAENDELRRLIEAADFFHIGNPDPLPVVMDGRREELWIAVDRRNHKVIRGDGIDWDDTEAYGALVAWAAERTPPLFPERQAGQPG